jgi:hypothetical protein
MQTLEFTKWELQELTCIYHEHRNQCLDWHKSGERSKVIMNRTEKLFDKLRFAEFAERQGE